MVEQLLPKQHTRVRFPSPAPALPNPNNLDLSLRRKHIAGELYSHLNGSAPRLFNGQYAGVRWLVAEGRGVSIIPRFNDHRQGLT